MTSDCFGFFIQTLAKSTVADNGLKLLDFVKKDVLPVLKEVWTSIKDLYEWFTSSAAETTQQNYLKFLKSTNKTPTQFNTVDEYLKYYDKAGLNRVAGVSASEHSQYVSKEISSMQKGGGMGFFQELYGSGKQLLTGKGMDLTGPFASAKLQQHALGRDLAGKVGSLPDSVGKEHIANIKSALGGLEFSEEQKRIMQIAGALAPGLAPSIQNKTQSTMLEATLNKLVEIGTKIAQDNALYNSGAILPLAEVKVLVERTPGTKAKVISGVNTRKNSGSTKETE